MPDRLEPESPENSLDSTAANDNLYVVGIGASAGGLSALEELFSNLSTNTVAEFVENEHILSSVRDLNVNYAQGFHLGRPQALLEVMNGV
ncbi:MAG: hypothetical protein AAFO95_04125 [Cyanobacteria bacterium J06600_6]